MSVEEDVLALKNAEIARLRAQVERMTKAFKEIAALNITPSTGGSVALSMRDIAYNILNALSSEKS